MVPAPPRWFYLGGFRHETESVVLDLLVLTNFFLQGS
jgi:hypothetical protein